MQILRTPKAQPVASGNETLPEPGLPEPAKSQGADSEIQQDIEGFFGFDQQQASTPTSFELLFMGAATGTQDPSDPAASQFSPERVVTVDEWLMAYPDGVHYLDLYINKMKQILENRVIPKESQIKQDLNNGSLSFSQAKAAHQLLEQIQATKLVMSQEIAKAEVMKAEKDKNDIRELATMTDLDGNRIIGNLGDPNKNYFVVAKHPNGMDVIMYPDLKTVAVNPKIDLLYEGRFTDSESVQRIDPKYHDKLPPGETDQTFDEAFELAHYRKEGWPEHMNNAQIQFSSVEGIWVLADEKGKAKLVTDPFTDLTHYSPKPLELSEDGKKYIQTPPLENEKSQWVFLPVTDLEIRSEPMLDEVDGGYVHLSYKFKDIPALRIRVQGYKSDFYVPTVSDGTQIVAATTVGIAIDNGSEKNEEGEEVFPEHSGRWSLMNIDASGLELTGKVLPVNPFDKESVGKFYKDLGIPTQRDEDNYFTTIDKSGKPSNDDETDKGYARGKNAANDTLFGGFLSPYGYGPYGLLYSDEAEGHYLEAAKRFGISFEGGKKENKEIDHTLDTMAAYLPQELNELKTGISIKGVRGNIKTTGFNDSVRVPAPDADIYTKMLPFAAEPVDAHSPVFATTVDMGGGRNIFVSGGGDSYVNGATFAWIETKPGGSGDMVWLNVHDVDSEDPLENKRVFVHVEGNSDVKIVNGEDVPDDFSKKELKERHLPQDADPNEKSSAANDDWYEVPSSARFAYKNNDVPGGLSNEKLLEGLEDAFETAFNDAYSKLNSEVIHKDPFSEESLTDIGAWDFPAFVVREQKDFDAFFAAWEDSIGQGPSMDLEEMKKEKNL